MDSRRRKLHFHGNGQRIATNRFVKVLLREVEKFRRKDNANPVPRLELSNLDVDDLERLGSLALHTAKKKRDALDTNPELTPSSSVNLHQRRRGIPPPTVNLAGISALTPKTHIQNSQNPLNEITGSNSNLNSQNRSQVQDSPLPDDFYLSQNG